MDVVDFYTKFRMIYFQFIFEFSSFKKQNFFKISNILNMFAYFYYYVNTKEYFIHYIYLVWLIFVVYFPAYFWIISCPHCFFYYNFWSLRRVRKESLCISDLLLRKVNGINYWVAQWLRMDFFSFTIYYCLALRVYCPEKHLTMFTFSRYLGESGERGKRGETQAWVR